MELKLLLVITFIILCYEIQNYGKTKQIGSLFFTIGFILYLILPIIILFMKELDEESLKLYFYPYKNYIEMNFLKLLSFLGIMYTSRTLGNRFKVMKEINFNDKIYLKILNLVFFSFFLLGVTIIMINKKAIWLGYSYFGEFRSVLASISIILMTLTIYNLLTTQKKNSIYLWLTFIISFILMLMGSRMYFICNLLTYLSFCEGEYKILSKNKIKMIIFFIILFFIAGIITIRRLGSFDYSIKFLLFNNLKEFLFTSLSFLSYFSLNTIKILSLYDNTIITLSPFGALNVFVSLFGYFGIVGGIILLFIFGMIIKFLSRQKNKILKTWYYILCGGIMFMFFRDPFHIFWIKLGLEYSILVLLFSNLLTKFIRKLYIN